MGTITRTFANNITTSGVFKPTAFNNASFDNVTSVPSGSVEGGNMVLLSTQTASGSSSISFTSGIDSTYKEYMFIFNNIHPSASSADFSFNMSTDGGSNYNVTKTSANARGYHRENGTQSSLSYDTSKDLAQSTGYQHLGTDITSVNPDECGSGYIHLFDPSSTTFVKHYLAVTSNVQTINGVGNFYYNFYHGGYANTTSAINAIDFKFSAGNIDDGTIQMFGIL